jgi:hypothetical protein
MRHALSHYVDTMERYGIHYVTRRDDTPSTASDGRIGLQIGSPTYGRGWRVYRIPTGQSGHSAPPIGSDYLGSTAREAHHTLMERVRTMHDMAAALNLPKHETGLDRSLAALEAAHERRNA